MSAFFVCTPVFSIELEKKQHTGLCEKTGKTRPAQVKWVYDGDTFKLTNNKKLRVIGIDTPEMPHRAGKQAEPYAGQATEALRALLSKHQYHILIQYDKQRKDKYKRTLAHVFTPDNINVSEWLLQQGLATLLIIPPNDRYLSCYREAEKKAQLKKLNIWKLPHNQIRDTSRLKHSFSGYVRLKGTVKEIKRQKNKISITLDHQIYITIKKPDLRLFKGLDAGHLKGRVIKVTGILYRHGKRGYIRVRHPVYLDVN